MSVEQYVGVPEPSSHGTTKYPEASQDDDVELGASGNEHSLALLAYSLAMMYNLS